MCLGGKAQCDTAPATASPCLAAEPVPHQAVAVGHHGVPLRAGLGAFPTGALSYEADNLTFIFIE